MPIVRLDVRSWNVLADNFLSSERYPDSPAHLLQPGARLLSVCEMASSGNPGLLCLQEAEPPLFDLFRSAMGPEWDIRWCPKDQGRPDGLITAVRSPWRIDHEDALYFVENTLNDRSGHVAHILQVSLGDLRIEIANTHLRWAPAETPIVDHVGVKEALELILALDVRNAPIKLIAGDVNDVPGGPVRGVLASAGYSELQSPGPTASIEPRTKEPVALDVIAAEGFESFESHPLTKIVEPLPSDRFPSDHVPVDVSLYWE